MLKLQEKFRIVREQGKVLRATNCYNFETMRAVPEVAKNQNAPLILQLTKSSIDYLGLKNELADNNEINLRKTFPPAINAVRGLVKHKLSLVN